MLIGVDAGCLGVKDERLKVGVYQVAKNLLLELSRLENKDTYLLYSFYPIDKKLMQSLGSRFRNIIVKPSRGWMKIWLPLRLLNDRPDIFLGLSQSLPIRLPGSSYKSIGVLYDLAYERFPEYYQDYTRLQKNTTFVARQADKIITISDHAKKDLLKKYPEASDKVEVAYLGVYAKTNTTQFKSKNPYFLFVGALKPAKNLPTVLQSFHEFTTAVKRPHDLFIVGGDRWLDSTIEVEYEKLPKDLQERVHFLGVVSDKKLWELYAGATALIMPSLYEGFGLPLVEAMTAGCPVIASDAGAIPEVVGEGALLSEPLDSQKIAKYMEMVATDKKTRAALIKKGYTQAKKYSWEKFARQVLDIIHSL